MLTNFGDFLFIPLPLDVRCSKKAVGARGLNEYYPHKHAKFQLSIANGSGAIAKNCRGIAPPSAGEG